MGPTTRFSFRISPNPRHLNVDVGGLSFCYTSFMSWAGRRRLVILIIVGAIVVAFLSILFISTLYKAPSCSDGIQNQGEEGIDCGGPCSNLCYDQEEQPTVLFTKAVNNGQGRLDAIAEVENPNSGAGAKDVSYTITFYNANQTEVGGANGTLDLPPNATVPVFIPGVATDNEAVAGAFLTIATSSIQWFSMPLAEAPLAPVVLTPQLGGSSSAPRIQAVLTNNSITPLTNVQAVVFVHDSTGDIIAASATVVPTVPAQGTATALFTWNAPFSGVPALIEVIPVTPLP